MPIYEKTPVFACACTAYGFKSLFNEIFNPEQYQRVYILKGSCGSGKSGIIRKIAAECQKRGSKYELFACSFDPASLDGIIILEPEICIIDGTSPHIAEPKYPGAVEIVLNTGETDEKNLASKRDDIIGLCKNSSAAFGKSYSFLRASLEIQNNLTDIITENFQFDKMFSAIKRFCERNFIRGGGYSRQNRFTEVICKDGFYQSKAFFARASKKCLVTDTLGTAHLLLGELLQWAARCDMSVTVSLSPLDSQKINALYLPDIDMAFHTSPVCTQREEYYHVFNMARFVDKDTIRASKYKIRFLKKCFCELVEQAADSMAQAYRYHMELESIYNLNTDYSVNDRISQKLLKELFGV